MSKIIEVFYRADGVRGWEIRMVGNPAWRWGYCSTQAGAWGHAKRLAHGFHGVAIMLSRLGRVRRVTSYPKGGADA
jgi:hypothetical protein